MFQGEQFRSPSATGEIQTRERLSDNAIDAYLSFLGNNEIKIAILLGMILKLRIQELISIICSPTHLFNNHNKVKAGKLDTPCHNITVKLIFCH